jgi:hypothetical protein
VSYDAAKHENFTRRNVNWARQLWALCEEGNRLKAIYDNEAESGAHADFVDNSICTKAEQQSLIQVQQGLISIVYGTAAVSQADRRHFLTPFLQGE